MNKQPPTDPSDNAFKTLANVTAILSQGRSDAVAITGIVGLVLVVMTSIAVTGFVYLAAHSPPSANSPAQQSSSK
jgi:hypothetical protein